MARPTEVAAADVETEMHFRLVRSDAFVVSCNIEVKKLVEGEGIGFVFLPALDHVLGAEVSEIGIINLDIADASLIEDVELGLVC